MCISTVNDELEIAATVWVQLCAWMWVCGWMCVCVCVRGCGCVDGCVCVSACVGVGVWLVVCVCLCAWVCMCIFHSFIDGGDSCLLSHHLWCQYSMQQLHTSRTYCYILPLQLIPPPLPSLLSLPPTPPSPLAAGSNMGPFQLGLAVLAYCGQPSSGH